MVYTLCYCLFLSYSKPRLCLLPAQLQTLLLAFLHQHQMELPASSLRSLLVAVQPHLVVDTWPCLLCGLMEAGQGEDKQGTRVFTERSGPQADTLLATLAAKDGGQGTRGVGSPWRLPVATTVAEATRETGQPRQVWSHWTFDLVHQEHIS